MYLYKVTTTASYESYVVADNPTEAYETFRKWLDEKNYGCYFHRELRSVECIAKYRRISDEYKMLLLAQDSKDSETEST